jgi:2-dehydro-3-deoxyphosphogluconate aldolase/(4S)-4-hydroxy-2-oxoglutarate aldolase
VLPVLTVTDVGRVEATCRALLDGGVSCVEITYRTACANEAIMLASQIPGLLVGAGTVADAGQAAAAAQAGARFAVAPGLSEPVVAATREIGLPFFPGVATPMEIGRAADLGCRVLKVFPVSSLGGTAFLRSVSAPYPGLRFIPTGGISASTIGEYRETSTGTGSSAQTVPAGSIPAACSVPWPPAPAHWPPRRCRPPGSTGRSSPMT